MVIYPAQIDTDITLPAAHDNITPVSGAIFNKLREAILNVENTLGINPAGSYGNVSARLYNLEAVMSPNLSTLFGLDIHQTISGQKVIGIQGNPISAATPNVNDVFSWNGLGWAPGPASVINGTSISSGGSLTVGTILRATSGSAATWGALNLANSSAITGILSTSNQASQSMGGDLTGTTASALIASITGSAGAFSISAKTANWSGDPSSKRSASDFIGSLSTSNATPATATLFTITSNSNYGVDLLLLAINDSHPPTLHAVFKISAVIYGDNTTTAHIDGSVSSNSSGTTSSASATIITNGSSGIQLQVTGISATNIRWGYEAHVSKLVY